MDREVLDPARVMEGAHGGMGHSRAMGMESGIDNSLDFLKNAVDLGVRVAAHTLAPTRTHPAKAPRRRRGSGEVSTAFTMKRSPSGTRARTVFFLCVAAV